MPLESPASPNHFLNALAERTAPVVFAYDTASGRFSYLNPAFEKVWHRTRQSAMGNPASLLRMVHPEDRRHLEEVYRELLEGAIVKETEFRIVLRDKSERWVCLKPLLLEDEGLITGYAEDITAAKRYNDNLKKFSDKKNSILNILSHDLAGPLAMIHSLSQVLAEDLGPDGDGEVRKVIGLIERSSQQGMRLIQEFIRQEFLESSKVELIKRRVDLVQALREIMEEYGQTQQMTGKAFRFHAPGESVYLSLDDNKFMQAVNNLISNAIKFTPDGGQITVSLEEGEETVLLKVEDTGMGIPEKYHATLFDKFTNARRPGLKGEPSVGLGMSIIRTIVEWHQGRIWFESEEGKGTCFYIELPKQ